MSCVDGLRPGSDISNRSSRKPKRIGQLHKGHGVVARSSSIPSKYQTYVTSNAEREGFQSTARRFTVNETFNPGPATYTRPPNSLSDAALGHVSSAKGSHGFPSKTKRFAIAQASRTTIGPGQYNPQFVSSASFSRASCTSNFHQPIALKTDNPSNATPAPNQYQLPSKHLGTAAMQNQSGAVAAFRSRSKRDALVTSGSKDVPAPGTYHMGTSFSISAPGSLSAPFKSKTLRSSLPAQAAVPGPGAYCPFEAVTYPERKLFPKRHYLGISAPAIPLPPSPPSPGPGHYNLVDYSGQPKRYATSSAFVSTTNRWLKNAHEFETVEEPGPASYDPIRRGRRSFISNSDRKWI